MTELFVTEIYKSIQGESTWVGTPCTFVRLSTCPLRCRWCDTAYAFKNGTATTISAILQKVNTLNTPCVELTGGEPLAQDGAFSLMTTLIKENYHVLLETSGSIPIKQVPKEVHIIMDLKCPDSKMSKYNHWANLDYLKPSDEIKFVIASALDFDWAKQIIREQQLDRRFSVLLSPAWGLVSAEQLTQWLLESQLNCRLNLQIHKYIWHPRKKGV